MRFAVAGSGVSEKSPPLSPLAHCTQQALCINLISRIASLLSLKLRLFIICIVLGAISPRVIAYSASKNRRFHTEIPRRSQDFVDSIGVNTHINYFDTSYGDISLVAHELRLLGVRHIRDGAVLQNDDYNKRLYDGWGDLSEFGVRFNMVLDPRGSIKAVDPLTLERLLHLSSSSVESIEGPNELDVSGLPDWPKTTRSYQQEIFSAVADLPSDSKIPLIGPSMAFIANGRFVGDLSGLVTYGNLHSYPAGREPAQMLGPQIELAANIYPHRPLVITETGYHNALEGTNPQPGVSEVAASKYIPRLLLEAFNLGIVRTYLYEFVDESSDPTGSKQEQHWGLLRSDGSEKPAFLSLRNLLAVLTASPTSANNQVAPLAIEIKGDESIHHTLLEHVDGSYYLLLWQEVSSYDIKTHEDRHVAARSITAAFPKAHRTVSTYDPLNGTAPVSVAHWRTALSIEVPDHVIILKISE
jgi:hypothetical protein